MNASHPRGHVFFSLFTDEALLAQSTWKHLTQSSWFFSSLVTFPIDPHRRNESLNAVVRVDLYASPLELIVAAKVTRIID
jgi:hypothetical protein